MRYEIRPLGHDWTEPKTPDDERHSASLFRASWKDTIKLLCREVERLGGDLIVVQVDVAEVDLRQDGMLRARAQVGFPGVRISFDSKHGPLTYSSDAYDQWYGSRHGMQGWQANVRAIALALEALRAVDRYGVTRRGEQYTGWRAIAAPSRSAPTMTVREAAEFIHAHTPLSLDSPSVEAILSDAGTRRRAYRVAAAVLHPDRGGDHDQFAQLTLAMEVLGAGEPP